MQAEVCRERLLVAQPRQLRVRLRHAVLNAAEKVQRVGHGVVHLLVVYRALTHVHDPVKRVEGGNVLPHLLRLVFLPKIGQHSADSALACETTGAVDKMKGVVEGMKGVEEMMIVHLPVTAL
jgi:hypothetical protein